MPESTDVAAPTACDKSAGGFVFASAAPAAPAVVTASSAAAAPPDPAAAAGAAAAAREEGRFATEFDGDEGLFPSGSSATAAAVVAVVVLDPARGPKISRSFSMLACSRLARTLARAASLLARAAQRRRFTCSFVHSFVRAAQDL